MRNLGIYIFTLFVLASCAETKTSGFVVNGQIGDSPNLTVYFDRLGPDYTTESLMNTKTSSDGSFDFKFPEKIDAGVYRIKVGAQNAYVILKGDESKISFDGNVAGFKKGDYTIDGSPLSDEYKDLMVKFKNKELDMGQLVTEMSSADPLVAYQVTDKILKYKPDYAAEYVALAQRLKVDYPDLRLTNEFGKQASNIQRRYAQLMAQQKVKVGNDAPDIELKSPNGKMYKLSDLKGKVVLLDFWASWCGPCRKENPNVVDLYNKYNKDGFEVFSVSLDGVDTKTKNRLKDDSKIKMQLDRSKERWVKAIEKDRLSWPYHVSDLKKWECAPAAEYGVTSIPKTFLIGRDGKIANSSPGIVNGRRNHAQLIKDVEAAL